MEEEKKKRKNNKRKKNKQQRQSSKGATEDDGPDRVRDGNGLSNGNHEGGDVDRDQVSDDCVDACSAAEGEKQSIMLEKGNLEKSFKQLQCENDLISEEKACLESTIMELKSEKESWLIKEASLEEKISKLSDEKAFLSSEQGNLEEMIKQLNGEKESWVSKENSTKEIISKMEADVRRLHLQVSELEELKSHSVQENSALKDHLSKLQIQIEELERHASIAHPMDQDLKLLSSCLEGSLDQKIRQLSDEKKALVEALEERVQQLEEECQSRISKENSSKDEITNMGNEIRRLRLQVVEIEELKNNAIEENQSLEKCVSELREQIKELEKSLALAIASEEQAKVFSHSKEHENLNSQIEAACSPVEKLITENAELVEKVNELYPELDQQNPTPGLSIPTPSESSIQVADNTRFQDEQPKSYEIMPAEDETILRDKEVIRDTYPPDPLDSFKMGEIVQIPLDDVEGQIRESQETVPSSAVPLSDAPLIGAPFRLISFMARYVSGADLVDKPKA